MKKSKTLLGSLGLVAIAAITSACAEVPLSNTGRSTSSASYEQCMREAAAAIAPAELTWVPARCKDIQNQSPTQSGTEYERCMAEAAAEIAPQPLTWVPARCVGKQPMAVDPTNSHVEQWWSTGTGNSQQPYTYNGKSSTDYEREFANRRYEEHQRRQIQETYDGYGR